jgi:hypothetical protein
MAVQKNETDKKRFTTLIDDQLLSQIKLISYFSNKKLNETINESLKHYITHFENYNNTKISEIISFQSKFKQLENSVKVEDKK